MKRGDSGLSLVVGVDKPSGMTSHDVIAQVRRIFGEKRIGHAGTLDPLATGVLPVLIGPAARLNKYMTCEDKVYEVVITFGTATDTDDSQGEVISRAQVPVYVSDASFAEGILTEMEGAHMQIPPAYSAIKVKGKKACDEARKGHTLTLKARRIYVYDAKLLHITEDELGKISWKVRFHVSKGTYIRSLARDIGKAAGTLAHMSSLRRVNSGNLCIDDCVSLNVLNDIGEKAALDVVKLLGYKFAFLSGSQSNMVRNGRRLPYGQLKLHEYVCPGEADGSYCTSGIIDSVLAPEDGELISLVESNRLQAICRYDAELGECLPECVFQIGVSRGSCC